MANEQQLPIQYEQVYSLVVKPGIKRDGTVFESSEYSDGTWCRFQRGVPKKIGGYAQLFSTFNGIPRGMSMNSYNGVNYVFAGNSTGLDVFVTGQSFGIGAGPYSAQFVQGYSPFTVTSSTSNTITITSTTNLTTAFTAGSTITFLITVSAGSFVVGTQYTILTLGTTTQAQWNTIAGTSGITYAVGSQFKAATTGASSGNGTASTSQTTNPLTYTVSSSTFSGTTTVVTFSSTFSGTINTVLLDNTSFTASSKLLWQFDYQYNPQGGVLNLVTHPGQNLANVDNGVASQVFIGATTPNQFNQWTFTGLADTSGTAPTYKPIVVDGGVCVLHPFIFVYGSNGFIANNNVSSVYANQSLTDWNGPLANQVNVATGKIVKGLPVRGGTNSPSGLFWATDSLIRVSFVNNGSIYWQYDIVSSNISIMSSSSVVEMDGLYYWMGVDRFYVYNGMVRVLPNDKNVNWLFNNLNYTQRQKVWAVKIPRYNEIWWFYPRGSATECTDAIIYNTKDQIWYDAGQAEGAQRSSGCSTEVFPTPIFGGWNYTTSYTQSYTVVATPTGQSAPTAYQFYLTGDVTPAFSPNSYFTFSNLSSTTRYQVASSTHIFNTTIGSIGVTLVTATTTLGSTPNAGSKVYIIQGGYPIWQHEIGLNKVSFNSEEAIYSSFTTNDISWVSGSPSAQTSPSINRRLHLRRIEPDFVQSGTMSLNIRGLKFANSTPEIWGPYTFDSTTEKIDLRVENRETALTFESNVLNGNYEMGRILITAEYGDERP